MILRELTASVSDKLDIPARTVHKVLDVAMSLLVDELVQKDRLEWRGLGTFTVRTYPPRKIHNPATGKTTSLPARRSVTFKPSARLRSKLKPLSPRRPARSSRNSRKKAR